MECYSFNYDEFYSVALAPPASSNENVPPRDGDCDAEDENNDNDVVDDEVGGVMFQPRQYQQQRIMGQLHRTKTCFTHCCNKKFDGNNTQRLSSLFLGAGVGTAFFFLVVWVLDSRIKNGEADALAVVVTLPCLVAVFLLAAMAIFESCCSSSCAGGGNYEDTKAGLSAQHYKHACWLGYMLGHFGSALVMLVKCRRQEPLFSISLGMIVLFLMVPLGAWCSSRNKNDSSSFGFCWCWPWGSATPTTTSMLLPTGEQEQQKFLSREGTVLPLAIIQ